MDHNIGDHAFGGDGQLELRLRGAFSNSAHYWNDHIDVAGFEKLSH